MVENRRSLKFSPWGVGVGGGGWGGVGGWGGWGGSGTETSWTFWGNPESAAILAHLLQWSVRARALGPFAGCPTESLAGPSRED